MFTSSKISTEKRMRLSSKIILLITNQNHKAEQTLIQERNSTVYPSNMINQICEYNQQSIINMASSTTDSISQDRKMRKSEKHLREKKQKR